MNGALKEIMEELRTKEKEYVSRAKYIRIHPKWFNEVAACDKEGKYLTVDYQVQAHRLCGYPFIITQDVEKWTIDFKE